MKELEFYNPDDAFVDHHYSEEYSIIKGTVKSSVNISKYWYPYVDIGAYAFPKSVDGFANEFGKVSTILGRDGKIYQLLRVQGSYGGKMAIFEYIKNPLTGEINHRFFNVP